jgi:hypothetical protein
MTNFSPDFFASLVQEARQMPEVRSELIEAFKTRIRAGHYPSQETMTGLARLIGAGIVRQARSTSSSQED